jgi:uncharacterized membrane protein
MNVREERGQTFVITAIFMLMLVGMSALVLDVGSWFREKRQLQSTADAAALAGAQVLPTDWSTAKSLALEYAGKATPFRSQRSPTSRASFPRRSASTSSGSARMRARYGAASPAGRSVSLPG